MFRQDLLEAGEANALVGAILWMAQTILETLQPGKLADWLRQVGLTDAIEELKSEVERMETVVNGVKGRAVGNKPLARSLARVKQLMYDADDVVDELDYFRLQEGQVKGVMISPSIGPEGMDADGAEQVDASANTSGIQQQVQGVRTAPAVELEGMGGDGAGQVDANTGVMLAPASEPEGMNGDRDGAERAGASANNVGMQNSSGRKNRSKAWDHFRRRDATKAECIYCAALITVGNGTSGLHKHIESCKKKRLPTEETPNRPSAGDSAQNGSTTLTNDLEGRKRMRIEYIVATTTNLWDKAEFFKRIQEIVFELRRIRGNVIEYLKDSIARSGQCQINISDTRVRTTSSRPGKVYGRDVEKDKIIKVIKAAKWNNITVIPIVGILGVGKTTLAKLVYNDPLVERKFEPIWIWVSNIFDKVRVTREILDVVTLANHEGPCKRESYEGVSNYSKLLEVLKKHMACLSKKFLLVLDDVYACMGNSQWKDLIDALGSSCRKGSVIIVTARNLSVARRLGTVQPLQLGALRNDDFWLLFKACALGDSNYKEHIDICRQIATKLNGNPLAAESAADMLREQPTLHHWESTMENGVWESPQFRGGIVVALKISYFQLPYSLQQCLLLCSIFPNGYLFHIDNLVYMWISSGFVKSVEAVQDYLNALVDSGFFEHVETEESIPHYKKSYVMCGIMHEFLRLVSRAEFATMDGLECKEVLPTVRHFSVLIDSLYHEDERGKFKEKLKSTISSVRRLRTLILIGHYDSLFFQSFHTFMCSLVNCTHLRYLKLENKGSNEALPIPLSKFYHLKVLDVGQPVIVDGSSDLISMRHLVLTEKACGALSPAWSSYLQTIHLEDCKGWEILPSLENLPSLTKLKLKNMPKVVELVIPSLEELVLIDMPKLETCFSNSVRDLNSSLRVLEIKRCQVLTSFSLFKRCEQFGIEHKLWLTNVNEITIHECPYLWVSNPLPPSSRFCKLSIRQVSAFPDMEGSSNGEMEIAIFVELPLDDKILSFHNVRIITRLKLEGFGNLLYFSIEGLKQLVCLKRLEICSCIKYSSLPVLSTRAHEDMAALDFDALPSLECLIIKNCGAIGEWLSVMLQHLRALEELHLVRCQPITWLLIDGEENSFPNLISTPISGNPDSASTRSCPDNLLRVPSNLISSLKKIDILCCDVEFRGNKEGLSVFTSLEELIVCGCELELSLVHEDEIDDGTNGRWLLPCSLCVLDIREVDMGEKLQLCFPRDLTCLTILYMSLMQEVKSLQLHSCTALEKLIIRCCDPLVTLEGVQSLRNLRYLELYSCEHLPPYLKSVSMQGYELCPRLEKLRIDDLFFLTLPFCKHLTSLKCLQFKDDCGDLGGAELTQEQEAAIQLLTSLQQLRFDNWWKLSDLPMGLHSLPSLKRLEIFDCPSISRLPDTGLPPSLEELNVRCCSKELTEHCRTLATSKLKVIIEEEEEDEY